MAVCKKELAEAVLRAKEQNELTNELAILGLKIARLYLSQKAFSRYPREIIEDIISHWSLNFVRKWEKLNPEKNCFSWITYSVRSSHYVYMRSQSRRIAREERQKEENRANADDRKDDWSRALTRLRHGDDEGIVPESEWLAEVRQSN